MNLGLSLIENTLAVTLENITLLIVILASSPFFAKDFKIGLLIIFVTTSGLFMGFFAMGMNWVNSLIVSLMSLVMLTFTLYFVSKVVQSGAGVI